MPKAQLGTSVAMPVGFIWPHYQSLENKIFKKVMTRKYLMQGDVDGACFLYSVANSVIALGWRRKINSQQWVDAWANALEFVPFSSDFLNGNLGTQNYDNNSDLYGFAVRQALSEYMVVDDEYKYKYDVTTHPKINSIKGVKNLILEDSVVVLNISGDHWVCVVDVDENLSSLLSVCSELGGRVNNYQEKDCRFNRKYNREIVLNKKYRIHMSSVIQIKRV